MSKKQNKKTTWDEPMNGSMKFFLAGCVAELYLMIVRRYYIQGTITQLLAWYDLYLKLFAAVGGVLLVIGIALFFKKQFRPLSYYAMGFGAFLAASNLLVWRNMSLLSPLMFLVPVVMLVVLLWGLYDRECALALTMLGGTIVALLLVRQGMTSSHASLLRILVVVYLVAVIAVTLLVKMNKLGKLLPAKSDLLPVYVCSALSVVGLASTFAGAAVAYYTMWVLAFAAFALVVYYTVKQL